MQVLGPDVRASVVPLVRLSATKCATQRHRSMSTVSARTSTCHAGSHAITHVQRAVARCTTLNNCDLRGASRTERLASTTTLRIVSIAPAGRDLGLTPLGFRL